MINNFYFRYKMFITLFLKILQKRKYSTYFSKNKINFCNQISKIFQNIYDKISDI